MTESTLQQATDCGAFTLSYCTKRAPTCSPLCTWVYQYEPRFTTADQRSPITHAILLYRKTCAMSTWPRHKNGRCSMSWMRVRQQNGKETLSIPWPWTTLQPALVRKTPFGRFFISVLFPYTCHLKSQLEGSIIIFKQMPLFLCSYEWELWQQERACFLQKKGCWSLYQLNIASKMVIIGFIH